MVHYENYRSCITFGVDSRISLRVTIKIMKIRVSQAGEIFSLLHLGWMIRRPGGSWPWVFLSFRFPRYSPRYPPGLDCSCIRSMDLIVTLESHGLGIRCVCTVSPFTIEQSTGSSLSIICFSKHVGVKLYNFLNASPPQILLIARSEQDNIARDVV